MATISDTSLRLTLRRVAEIYDARSVGRVGGQGYRMSTRLTDIVSASERLIREGVLVAGETRFLDVGCGDGRVNVLLGYLTSISVGIELDELTIEEHGQHLRELTAVLAAEGLLPPPGNIHLLSGDATCMGSYLPGLQELGLSLADFDLFFNFLTLHEECAALVADHARSGAHFILYGADRVLPAYDGLCLVETATSREARIAVYRKR